MRFRLKTKKGVWSSLLAVFPLLVGLGRKIGMDGGMTQDYSLRPTKPRRCDVGDAGDGEAGDGGGE